MGGAIIIASTIMSALLWGDITNGYLVALMILTFSYSCFGFFDDYKKIKYKNSKGLSGKRKLFFARGNK